MTQDPARQLQLGLLMLEAPSCTYVVCRCNVFRFVRSCTTLRTRWTMCCGRGRTLDGGTYSRPRTTLDESRRSAANATDRLARNVLWNGCCFRKLTDGTRCGTDRSKTLCTSLTHSQARLYCTPPLSLKDVGRPAPASGQAAGIPHLGMRELLLLVMLVLLLLLYCCMRAATPAAANTA
jgi:hypothetical protein